MKQQQANAALVILAVKLRTKIPGRRIGNGSKKPEQMRKIIGLHVCEKQATVVVEELMNAQRRPVGGLCSEFADLFYQVTNILHRGFNC